MYIKRVKSSYWFRYTQLLYPDDGQLISHPCIGNFSAKEHLIEVTMYEQIKDR